MPRPQHCGCTCACALLNPVAPSEAEQAWATHITQTILTVSLLCTSPGHWGHAGRLYYAISMSALV